MTTVVVSTHQAKSRLSELIRAAEAGDEVIVARTGKPVARIVPWPTARPARTAGTWAGRVKYLGDIVGPDPEVAALFEQCDEG